MRSHSFPAFQFGTALAWERPTTLTTANPVLRTTLLVSAIASGTFAATLAFSPAVIDVGQRLVFGRGGIVESTPVAAAPVRECAPLAKIVAALRQSRECN